ncbi:hypothetical protein P6P90_05295 [Ectobacillus antri]|jgi:hypothetical protein|uniref:Uncharacterized protein n=1 Tax=Ectobacillus antri TaxID=2486280 RepID=A0ABT6H365_9BACI|nr:hypothetical protein [Ectobacillus antri]MDG4655654.1 hypothetical protein [Ectobacillus antri]MDG5753412.1 hypothetical protein [Ectobacillus antri]
MIRYWQLYYPILFPSTLHNAQSYRMRQIIGLREPYLRTWPYSNVYYGNYFEA